MKRKGFWFVVAFIFAAVGIVLTWAFLGRAQPAIAWAISLSLGCLLLGCGFFYSIHTLVQAGVKVGGGLSSHLGTFIQWLPRFLLFLVVFALSAATITVLLNEGLLEEHLKKIPLHVTDLKTHVLVIALAFFIALSTINKVMRRAGFLGTILLLLAVLIWPTLSGETKQAVKGAVEEAGKHAETALKIADTGAKVAEVKLQSLGERSLNEAERQRLRQQSEDTKSTAKNKIAVALNTLMASVYEAQSHASLEITITREGLFQYQDVFWNGAQAIPKGAVYSLPASKEQVETKDSTGLDTMTQENPASHTRFIKLVNKAKRDEVVYLELQEVAPFIEKAVDGRLTQLDEKDKRAAGKKATSSATPAVPASPAPSVMAPGSTVSSVALTPSGDREFEVKANTEWQEIARTKLGMVVLIEPISGKVGDLAKGEFIVDGDKDPTTLKPIHKDIARCMIRFTSKNLGENFPLRLRSSEIVRYRITITRM